MRLTKKNILKVIEKNHDLGIDTSKIIIVTEYSTFRGTTEYNIYSKHYKFNVSIYTHCKEWEKSLIEYLKMQIGIK